MSDFAFKLASLAAFYIDLNGFTDANGYQRLTAIGGKLPGDLGTGDFDTAVIQDATRLDFLYRADLTSLPATYAADGVTVVTPAVMSGPHLDIRCSFSNGLDPSPADEAKMATLLEQLAAFFGAQAPATHTPDPAVQSAFGVGPKQYPTTVNGSMLIVNSSVVDGHTVTTGPLFPKFGLA